MSGRTRLILWCLQNKDILDRRIRESVEARRPSRTVRESSAFLPRIRKLTTGPLAEHQIGVVSAPYCEVRELETDRLREQIAGYDVRKQLPAVPSTLPVLILHGTADSESVRGLSSVRKPSLRSKPDSRRAWQDPCTTARRSTSSVDSGTRNWFRSKGSVTPGERGKQPVRESCRTDGERVTRYDYYTLAYWTGLLNTFLEGGDVSSLAPPPASSQLQPKL